MFHAKFDMMLHLEDTTFPRMVLINDPNLDLIESVIFQGRQVLNLPLLTLIVHLCKICSVTFLYFDMKLPQDGDNEL